MDKDFSLGKGFFFFPTNHFTWNRFFLNIFKFSSGFTYRRLCFDSNKFSSPWRTCWGTRNW